jgi:hypothetical protein
MGHSCLAKYGHNAAWLTRGSANVSIQRFAEGPVSCQLFAACCPELLWLK